MLAAVSRLLDFFVRPQNRHNSFPSSQKLKQKSENKQKKPKLGPAQVSRSYLPDLFIEVTPVKRIASARILGSNPYIRGSYLVEAESSRIYP